MPNLNPRCQVGDLAMAIAGPEQYIGLFMRVVRPSGPQMRQASAQGSSACLTATPTKPPSAAPWRSKLRFAPRSPRLLRSAVCRRRSASDCARSMPATWRAEHKLLKALATDAKETRHA